MRSTNAPLLDKDSDDSNISSIESMQNNTKWYKGLTHSHSDLSDGNSAPEFIVQWYKERGYNFLAISDHNMFDRQLFEKLSTAYNVPDKFLMLSGEELTMSVGTRDLHMNIVNICDPIEPHIEKDVVSTIKTNASNAEKQSEAFRRKVLVYVNHPDWNDYSISPEEIAGASGVKFMEIANCLGSVNHYGNGFTGGMEKYWDIVNTIRLGTIHDSPIFGLAADDAHDYEEFDSALANPGRGWVMIRSDALTSEAIIGSLERGSFYCTTGVVLRTIDFDPYTGDLFIEVKAENKVEYTIDFVGSPRNADTTRDRDGNYSESIGTIFVRTGGTSARYTLHKDDLYVRAHIHSSKRILHPFWGEGQCEEAWTQPVIQKP